MSVATFSPPIKATVAASSLPCIIIAIIDNDHTDDLFVAIDTDGKAVYLESDQFTFDFRYDIKSETWSDPTSSPDTDFGDDE
jgi:hypothetical protein